MTFWESFTKTYFEMNGYFVLSNLFPAIIQAHDFLPEVTAADVQCDGEDDTEQIHRAVEADLVAGKFEKTSILYGVDERSESQEWRKKPCHKAEFFPGEWKFPFVYCEVRANLARHNTRAQIKTLLDKKDKIEAKRKEIANRLADGDLSQVLVVIGVFEINEAQRELVNEFGWRFKQFLPMYDFMSNRFSEHGEAKMRVPYNDPHLEMLRFHTRVVFGDNQDNKDWIS